MIRNVTNYVQLLINEQFNHDRSKITPAGMLSMYDVCLQFIAEQVKRYGSADDFLHVRTDDGHFHH